MKKYDFDSLLESYGRIEDLNANALMCENRL